MEYLKIKCHRCGNTFDIYNSTINKQESAPHCPHCLVSMDRRQWERLIDAYLVFSEVNKNFRKYHEDRGEPLFQVQLFAEEKYVRPEDIYLE